MPDLIREILTRTAYRPIDVEALLDPEREMWVQFDPELGYVPADVSMKDGMDYSRTVYRHEPDGARRICNHRDKPCRINTYGDSFTQCQQVSDDETWQERLAAHIGEPIRNYGSGGYGVNQSCRRAMRMEEGPTSAEYVVLGVFDDDHIRNLDAARWIRTAWNEKERPADQAYPLHGLPWAHVRYDLERNTWIEVPGKCANGDELRQLANPERFYETFRYDEIVKLFALQQGGDLPETDLRHFEDLAKAMGAEVDLRDESKRAAQADRLHRLYGFRSTEYLLEKLRPWAEARNKKVMVLLSYCLGSVAQFLTGQGRFDPIFIDYLEQNGWFYVDTLQKHFDDFADFGVPIEKYISRYYIQAAGAAVFGHYNPTGNHFFGFSFKNELVDWLDPKPPAYIEH